MTAAQALTHPWLRDERQAVPLDLVIHKLVKSYVRATPFRHAAMKALSKAMTEDELYYLRAQFTLLEPKHGYVSLDNFRTVSHGYYILFLWKMKGRSLQFAQHLHSLRSYQDLH
ncbi:putative non-specific serine/threonine protein kinase [Rosa chinensis]|uniref:Putative non-specific serine/threonine protein kinase n=1 Tax=Rosa chinensis TaxID=74649 RepID=A0A2P6RWW2_ROSCH|nr:putative non-specific serine/threonine protein kinase [Rosa chinensis]